MDFVGMADVCFYLHPPISSCLVTFSSCSHKCYTVLWPVIASKMSVCIGIGITSPLKMGKLGDVTEYCALVLAVGYNMKLVILCCLEVLGSLAFYTIPRSLASLLSFPIILLESLK